MINGKHSASGRGLAHAGKIILLGAVFSLLPAPVHAAWHKASQPALVVTNEPLPSNVQRNIYSQPSKAPETTAAQVEAGSWDNGVETAVGHKVDDLRNQLFALQGRIAGVADRLAMQESMDQKDAADYYAAIATINTQLQSGTTPGNPRLVRKLDEARGDLERLSGTIAVLNGLAMDVSSISSSNNYLLESVRAAFSLSGAVEEDHVRLAQLEDAVSGTSVIIERMLNNVNDDVRRTTTYVNGERQNLATLALAVQTGDLFGKSLSNHPFSSATLASFSPQASAAPTYSKSTTQTSSSSSASAPASTAAARPLVKIRFDRPDVAYEQPVYNAVSEALKRYPNARFELVAVHPSNGNAAELAIESTRARRDAEKVLRSLTQMGLSLDRIDLSYMPSTDATSDEVHLYVR
ncbi:MAG TPA: hypothetical protein VL625_11390 [Patescibacteria group bacterium]|nr:hypothetical protein [Patescibacteria group bacterium]